MTKSELQFLIANVEQSYGLPSGLLDRLVALESSYNPRAFNSVSGASGLTQIIKRFHPTVNDPFDPYESLDYTARRLRGWFDEWQNWESSVAAWHSGETAVRRARAQGKTVPGTVDRVTGLSTAAYVNRITAQAGAQQVGTDGTGVTSGLLGFPSWAVLGTAILLVVVLIDD